MEKSFFTVECINIDKDFKSRIANRFAMIFNFVFRYEIMLLVHIYGLKKDLQGIFYCTLILTKSKEIKNL